MTRFAPLAAVAVLAFASPALAQEGWVAPGVTVNDARAWLLENGGEVGVPEDTGATRTLRVNDVLPWTMTFYRCQDTCADLQYSAVFTGPAISLEWVNSWNREHRYLKAHYVPAAEGAEPAAVVQYDVALTGQGPHQLAQSVSVWKQLQLQFAQTLQAASRTN